MGRVTYGGPMIVKRILSVKHEGVEYRCKERTGGGSMSRSHWLSRNGQSLDDPTAMKCLARDQANEAARTAEMNQEKERAALLAELYPPEPEPAEPPERVLMRSLEEAIKGAVLPGETAAAAVDRLAAVAARLDKGVIMRADSNERALDDIRDLLLLDPCAGNAIILEHLLVALPLSEWVRNGFVWSRMLASGKCVYQVWYKEHGEESWWERKSTLRGTQQDKYQSAADAMRMADAEHAELVRRCAARRAWQNAPEAEEK